jgi:hypothetical protein
VPLEPVVSDVDRDGNLDIVIACMFNGVGIHYGNGDGTFSSVERDRPPIRPYSHAVFISDPLPADFDGDGDTDIAFKTALRERSLHIALAEQASGSRSTYTEMFRTDAVLEPFDTGEVDNEGRPVTKTTSVIADTAVGDVNADGRPDLVVITNAPDSRAPDYVVALVNNTR